jgi:hypothetical protein
VVDQMGRPDGVGVPFAEACWGVAVTRWLAAMSLARGWGLANARLAPRTLSLSPARGIWHLGASLAAVMDEAWAVCAARAAPRAVSGCTADGRLLQASIARNRSAYASR